MTRAAPKKALFNIIEKIKKFWSMQPALSWSGSIGGKPHEKKFTVS